MSIFGTIMGKIFHHGQAAGQPAPAAPAPAPAPQAAPTPAAAASPQAAPRSVDVGAVLTEMALMQDGGGGNYRTSIVDLLHLLGLDHSLEARKELADELGVHAGAPGTAEQNIALHKAVMAKLAENGGVVPDSLRN
jgi:pyruvate/2-oxoglutarate dehydrogenase complex dihydrolipoamide acyltransferase (E2) component